MNRIAVVLVILTVLASGCVRKDSATPIQSSTTTLKQMLDSTTTTTVNLTTTTVKLVSNISTTSSTTTTSTTVDAVTSASPDTVTGASPVHDEIDVQIQEVEVREYQGEDLSSVNDFRENSIKGPQDVEIDYYTLEITGLVENELSLSYDQVLDNYKPVKKILTLHCVEGWSNTLLYEGVYIQELLDEAKIGEDANTLIFHAHDGYTSSLPLQYVQDKNIMIAYKMNNITLPPERGYPLQVVAEDKWGYKWVKWLTKIEVSEDEDYKGFWESRGYNNNADAQGPRRE